VLRVYDRGSGIIGGGKEAAERPLGSKLKLVSSLTGHKNHNWPIKSAFHVGKDCTLRLQPPPPTGAWWWSFIV
jgi:hypothetical protein